MGIEEIIAKHKEYLRKAQLDSLVKKSEAYKQAYAKPRHEALSQTQTQYEVSRRMLQNAGLASRRGNVVSGRENAIRAKLERFYRDYNAQLNNAAMERTEHDAQMMERDRQIAEQEASLQGALYRWRRAQQKAVRQQEQQTKKQQATQIATKAVDDVKETIKEKVKLAKEKAVKRAAKEKGQWQERQTDTHGGVEKTPVKESDYTVAMKYAMSQGAGKAEAVSFATQYVSEKQKEERAALAESTRKSWVTQSTGKDEKDTTIAKKQLAAAERYITEHSQEWDTAISEARKATPRDSVAKMKGQRAQREKAQAMSEYARAQLAVSAPEEMEQLLLLPEKDFQQRYEAAVELVKKLRGAKQTMDVLRYDPQSGVDPLDHGESTDEMLKAATETLAQLERVQRLRTITSADSMMFETFKAIKGHIPEAPTYATLTDKNGKNIQRAFDSGWDASDYRRTHDTKGSKYAALINEWSYINGRTALNYTQTHGVAKILRSERDTFTKGESESWRYDSFIGRCAAEFYHDPEEGGTKAQREQMESMLTLANLMTEDERARYNTILKQAGATEADKYFEYLYKNVLPERFDNYVNEEVDFQTRDAIGKVRESLMSVPMNVTQGRSGPIYTLTSKQEDAVAAKLAAKKYDLAQGTRDRIGQQLGEVGSFLYGTGMSMVDSAVVAAISSGVGSALKGIGVAAGAASKIGSAVGGAILGGSAFNSTYNESLEKGLDPIKARATAIGSGINEMLFESLSIGTLLEVTGNETVKVARNAFVNWIVNAAIQSGVEGSEEVFTDIGNRLWDNQVNNIFSEEQTKLREYIADGYTYDEARKKVDDEFAQQLGASFGGGALSGFFMGGGASFMGMVNTRQLEKYGKSLRTDTKAMDKLTSFDYKSEEAHEILKQGKLTNTDVGTLAVIRDQELTQQAHDYVAKLVKDGKISADVQKLIDKMLDNPILKESPNGDLVDFKDNVVLTAKEVAQIAPYEKYVHNAIDIRGDAKALMEARQAQEEKLDNPLITNEERARRIGQEFAPAQQESGLRSQLAGGINSQRASAKSASANPNVNKSIIEGMKLKETVKVKGNRVNTANGKVTFDYGNNKTTDNMTNDELIALRVAQSLAEKSGSNIHVESEFVGKDKNADGLYNPETDTVHINLKGKNSMIYTLAHELTHRIAELNKAGFADLLKAVKKELSRTDLTGDRLPEMYQDAVGQYMDGETSIMDALRKYEREHYRRNGIILDKDGGTKEVDEEIVCKCCETFLADPRFVQSMVEKHKTGAKAVYSFLKDVYNDMKALFGLAERNADEEGKGNAANISAESDILAQFGNIDRIFKLWSRAVKQMQKQTVKTQQGTAIKYRASDVGMTDENYLSLAQKVKDGTATDADKAELRKQVDAAAKAAGYPVHVYRGGGSAHNVFDTKRGAGTTQYGSGTYFTDAKGLAQEWAAERAGEPDMGYVGEYYVGIKKMFDDTSTIEPTQEWKNVERILKGYGVDSARIKYAQNYGFEGIAKALQSVGMISRGAFDAYSWKNAEKVNKILRDAGYDGIKGEFYDSYQYVIFDPTQAKSADLVTYDSDGNIIPLSERFKTDRTGEDAWKNEDIRYSVSTDVSTAIEDNGVVVDNQGEPVLKVHDHGDGVQYSYSTYRDGGRDVLKTFMKKDIEKYAKERRKALRAEGKTKAEIKSIVDADIADMRTQYERIMKQMDKIYEMSTKYLDKYASFGTWSRAAVTVGEDGKPVFSVIRSNGEYPMNIDFSLVCVKRRALDAVMNEIVKNGYMEKLVLDGESLVKVNNILRRRGFEVACMGCFVEAKRFRQQKVAEDFAEKYNEIVKSLGGEAAYANFGQDETVKQTEGIANKKDSELNWTRVNELIAQYEKKKAANSRAGKTVEEAIAFELKENPKSRVLLKSGDFMSTRGMDRVAEVAPSILSLYNKQKGTGGPKAVFGDMQYLNDIFKKQWNVNKAYAVGGVRVQSFSDFVPRMFFDYCQMVADLATRKLPAHAYTKEESFVKLFGLTGMKINMSLFPKVGSDGLAAGLQYKRSKNGDIVYKNGKPVITYAWAGESFDYEKAKEIQADKAYGKNCGTIAVGISNEHIRMMMADPTIRMIIPYHKSSLNPIIAELMGIDGFTDYTDFQRTKKDGTAIDVDFAFNERLHEVGDVQKVVKEYLDWCKENGYTAKFEQFAYNADGSINENYYKLLEDFSLFDEQGNYCPQEAVQMVYPDSDSAFGSMDALLDEYLKRDNDLQEARDAMIPAIAQDIIREVDKKHSLSNTDFKSDKLGNTEYLKYLQLGKKVVNQTATEAEIKEFKQRMVQLSEDNRMAFLDKLREKMIRADEAAKVREVRDRQIARLKAEFRESREKAREARVRRDIVNVLKNGNDRIVKLLASPTENAHVPVQLAQAVAEYAQRLNELLTTSVPKSGENAGIEQQTKKGELNAQKILDAYRRSFADEETIAQARAENPKYDPRGLLPTSEYDEQLVKMIEAMDSVIQGKRMSDLTTDELRLVMNTMRGVIHAVTDANKLIGTNENKTIWKAGDQMVEQFENAPQVSSKLRGYLETSLDLRRIARIFSGSNENAEFVKLVDQLNQGAIEKERIAQTLQSIFKPVTDEYGKEIRKWYGKNAEWIDTGIEKNGKKVEITKGMRVSLALHVLNEGNMRHIENGGLTIPDRELYRKGNLQDAYANGELVRLNKNQIEEIISHMTDAEKAYVEAAKELFHKRAGYYVNKTSLALLGYLKATVENYFPIHTDKNFTKTDFASLKQDGSIEGQGFLKERVMASNPVYLEDITSVVNRQIRGVALYAGLAIPMRNFNAVTNTSVYEDDNGVWSPRTTVKQTMTQKMGDYGRRVVEGFLTDVSEMSHVDVTPMERFAGKLAANYAKAVLTGNLKVALKQVASYPTAAAVIPWKYLAKGLASGKVDIDLINQYTPLYQMRREGQANEIASIMQKRGLEQKLPWLLGWITKMDVATVGRIWKAAEYMVSDTQNIPVGSDAYYQAVAKVFNDTVQQTQPNFTPLQRNAALRSKNPIVRSLVLFGTQRMQNGGILMEAAMELKQSKGKSKAEIQAAKQKMGRAVASQIVQNILLIVASLGVDALRGRMKGWQDDDKEITAESLAKGMGDMFLSNAIGSFLGGSEVYNLVSALYKKATGETAYDAEFTVPALDAAETLLNFVQNLPDVVKYLTGDHTDEEKLKKAKNFSYDLAKAFGYATGIPLENAVKDLFKGIIPALQDLSDAKKTGELIPYLHQSGKLDSKKTSERYKEWVSKGRKGSEFFYIDNKLKGATSREMRIDVLAGEDIPAEEKAQLMVLYDSYGATCEGPVVYDKKGKVIVDFASVVKPSPIETTLDEIAEATAAPTPEPTERPLSEAKQEGVKQAVAQGVPEQMAVDAFVTYQDMGKNKSDDYSRNDDFREWLFANVDDPHQRAVLEMQVIGQAASVKGAVTYRESGTVYRDYTDENWFKLSEHNLAKDGTNKRYDAGKKLEKTGLPVDKTVAIYEGLAQYTKKAEWTKYLKEHGLTDEQIRIFLWSRGWK